MLNQLMAEIIIWLTINTLHMTGIIIHFTPEDLMKRFEVIKKNEKYPFMTKLPW